MVTLLGKTLSEVLGALKNIPRTGWVQRGIPPAIAETVASHVYEASVLCLEVGSELVYTGIVSEEEVSRAVMITLVHDIGEGIVGDLNRFVSEEIGELKEKIEEKAIAKIGSRAILPLYREYRERSSIPSMLAHICDKLSTYLQAERYSSLGFDVREIAETSLKEIRILARELCRGSDKCIEIIEKHMHRRS
ncbi:metal dependent phosphohydrolase [Desulfurococcaceae archaeon AG1]|jgi:putative hydrolase of HD superfamily|nr:metal dependent phosphohydrolase [Desulfurococcaceae archaeon AG1]